MPPPWQTGQQATRHNNCTDGAAQPTPPTPSPPPGVPQGMPELATCRRCGRKNQKIVIQSLGALPGQQPKVLRFLDCSNVMWCGSYNLDEPDQPQDGKDDADYL